MTGFRLGYVIAPANAMRALVCMQQNLFISTAHFVQTVGLTALEHGDAHLQTMLTEYGRRRGLLIDGIRSLGLSVPVTPTGAFYVLADARHLGPDSLALAFDILERAHVALGPGRDFGEIAEGFLRFSFAATYDDVATALERLHDVWADDDSQPLTVEPAPAAKVCRCNQRPGRSSRRSKATLSILLRE